MSQTTTTNHETRLKEVYATFDALIKRGLKVGLFQDTAQVILCHNSLDAIRQIIDEQSKQQSGSDNMDSGKVPSTAGANSKTVPKERQTRKRAAAKADTGQHGDEQQQTGQSGNGVVDPTKGLYQPPLIQE